MSRVGKKIILIPEGVEVNFSGNTVIVKGPKGEISQEFRPEIKIDMNDKKIALLPKNETKKTNALWGLYRNLIFNMIQGVTVGFEKKLEIEGVGFKALIDGENIVLNVGFSIPVKIKIPQGIKITVEKNVVTVVGIRKDLVGQTAAIIRRAKPPEPYKGKGIRYYGEKIKKKLGKKAISTT